MRTDVDESENKLLHINVYSAFGTLIKQVQKQSGLGSSTIDIDASAFPKGNYQVSVISGGEKIGLLKVVK